ncbi:MAG: HxsD-like protein [Nanoarchaeota archaeon]|nr:HxsD-like protein [Nanoarchaeota archaeon]
MKIDKEIKIRFNKKFYSEDKLKKAIKDFKNISELYLSGDKNYYEIRISKVCDKTTDMKKTGFEFCNYVLGMMKLENRKL